MAAVARVADASAQVSSIIAEMTRPVSDILGGSILEPLSVTPAPPPSLVLRSTARLPPKPAPAPAHRPRDDPAVLDMLRPFCQPVARLLPGGRVPADLARPVRGKSRPATKAGPPPPPPPPAHEQHHIRPASPLRKSSRESLSSPPRERRTRPQRPHHRSAERPAAARKRRRADDASARSSLRGVSSPSKKAKNDPEQSPGPHHQQEHASGLKAKLSNVSPNENLSTSRKQRRADVVATTALRSSLTPSSASESSLDHTRDGRTLYQRKERKRRNGETTSPRPEKRSKSEKENGRRPTVRLTSKPIPDSMLNSERERPKATSTRSERDKHEHSRGRERERDVLQDHTERDHSRERERDGRGDRHRPRESRDPAKRSRARDRDRDSERDRSRHRDDRSERKRDDVRERTRDGHRDWDHRDKEPDCSRDTEKALRHTRSKSDGDSGESTRVIDEENDHDSERRNRDRGGKDSTTRKERRDSRHVAEGMQTSDGGSAQVIHSPPNEASSSGKRPRFLSQPAPKDSDISQPSTSSPIRAQSTTVELGALLAKRKRLNTDFFAAKNQLSDLLEKEQHDAFEQMARTAFRLGFEIALSKESELRLSEKQLRTDTSCDRSDKKRDIIDHFKYLTKKLAPNCIADLEKIGRKSATAYFKRGVQKVYLRQFALQRLWENDQRKRETIVRKAVADAIKSRREGGGGTSVNDQFSLHQLQSLKEVSDGYCNIISVLETAIRDLGEGCEEAGNECHMQ